MHQINHRQHRSDTSCFASTSCIATIALGRFSFFCLILHVRRGRQCQKDKIVLHNVVPLPLDAATAAEFAAAGDERLFL